LHHAHLVHCSTTGLGDEINLMISINTRTWIFNGPTLSLLDYVYLSALEQMWRKHAQIWAEMSKLQYLVWDGR
jgi:hypothetical protein